jgi:tRNA A-37 threonylcarbamoyl transferase component Bud32/tetratricopeptide (TPR) repeat protein
VSPLAALPAGTRVGPYTVVREIGRGATATVVLATGPNGEPVAVKARPRGLPATDRRFLREFESMRALRLPGVVRVFEAGMDPDHVWFSMEYVDGRPFLDAALAEADPDRRIDRVLDLACQLLDVLARLHAGGLAHRDIKPSNVLVDARGAVHVLDFGIGRTFERAGREGDSDAFGTLPYMAPEQLAGLPNDHRVDLFASGLMIHEALAGPRPPPANPLGWVTRTCLERLPPLAAALPRVPRRLSRTVERLLDVDPRARPTAVEASTAFRQVRSQIDTMDWPEPPFVDPGPWWSKIEAALADRAHTRVYVLDGPAGSGRRRAVEQLHRHALLDGARTLHVTCDVTRVGGPICDALEAVFGAGEDEARSRRLVGGGAGALRQMWPHLPVPPPSEAEPVPTISRVAEAAAQVLVGAASEGHLLIVVHALEQVDALSARALHRLAVLADRSLAVVLLHDPRWRTPLSEQVIGGLTARQHAVVVQVPALEPATAVALARAVAPHGPPGASSGGWPQRVVEEAYAGLAAWRREPWEAPGAHLWPLAVHEPIPVAVLVDLVGEGVLTSPWIQRDGASVSLAGDTARRAARARLADRAKAARALAEVWARRQGPDHRPGDQARLWLLAGDAGAARRPAARAGIQALERGRFAEARRWLFLVDALPPDPAGAPDFDLAMAKARVALVTEAEAPPDLLVQVAANAASNPEQHARVALLEAASQLRRGEPRSALASCLRLASPGRSPPTIAVESLLLATRCRLRLGQPDDARAQLTRAEALLAAAPSPALADEVALLRAAVLLYTQDLDAAAAQGEALLLAARRRGHVRDEALVSHVLAQALRLLGRRHRAEALARAAVSLAQDTGDLALAAEARLVLAGLLVDRGDAVASRALLHQVLRQIESLRLHHRLAQGMRVALQIAVARLDPHEADLPLAHFRAHPHADPEAPGVLVRWLRDRGDLQGALEVPPPPPNTWGWLLWSAERARAWLLAGDTLEARRAAEVVEVGAIERGFEELEQLGRLLRLAATPGDPAWAATCRRAMAETWTELCFAALELDARRHVVRGDSAAAAACWQALRARCEELGYRPGWEEATGWLDETS